MLNRIGQALTSYWVDRGDDLFLTAASFEPRCCRGGDLLVEGSIKQSIVFRYSDTLDSALGMANTRALAKCLKTKSIESSDIIDCSFTDPFSVVRGLRSWLRERSARIGGKLTVTIDVSCFTKLHLLLLLEYLDREMGESIDVTRVIYTEPLTYAASFGRQLTYGIRDTFYIPFNSPDSDRGHAALLVFLGHEALRAERIIEELEPDLSVLVQGTQGYSDEVFATHLAVNSNLIARVRYNSQFRLLSGSPRDFLSLTSALEGVVAELDALGFRTFYLAPLGTKLQTIAFEVLRRSNPHIRLLISYAVPKRYERKYYSQGVGPSWTSIIPRERTATPEELLEVAGVYYRDPCDIPVAAASKGREESQVKARSMAIGSYRTVLEKAFTDPEIVAACLSEGKVVRTLTSSCALDEEYLINLQRETGRLCYVITRDEVMQR